MVRPVLEVLLFPITAIVALQNAQVNYPPRSANEIVIDTTVFVPPETPSLSKMGKQRPCRHREFLPLRGVWAAEVHQAKSGRRELAIHDNPAARNLLLRDCFKNQAKCLFSRGFRGWDPFLKQFLTDLERPHRQPAFINGAARCFADRHEVVECFDNAD